MTDTEHMSLAVELAKKDCGWVNPNPMMDAMIVRGGQIIGQGYYEKCGVPHAERNAPASCESSPAGTMIYVILEPCCRYSRTPPCTDAILEDGIRRVATGSRDPSPQVSGKGTVILCSHGIEVMENRLRDEYDTLNQSLFHYV